MKLKLHPEKDQHLLLNKEIISKIVEEANLSKNDKVIEVGAGTGILTKELVKNSEKVLAFETDDSFKKELDKIKAKNLELIYDNALNHSWRGYDKIVSNIPFSLSEPTIMKAIEENISFMVLTIGENFKKLMEKKTTKIGIFSDLFYNITPIMKINKSEFTPPPRIDAWIVKFEKKAKSNNIETILKRIVFRNGKIKNALIYSLVESGKTKNQAREIIEKLGINPPTLNKPVTSITGKFMGMLRERLEKFI